LTHSATGVAENTIRDFVCEGEAVDSVDGDALMTVGQLRDDTLN